MEGKLGRLRWIGRLGLAFGIVTLGLGLVFTGGSAVIVGDWWLAPEPWIGTGLRLLTVGMAATGVFALVLVLVEPLGWLRLVAVPPAAIAVLGWFFLLAVGPLVFGWAGAPRAKPDVTTILYTLPEVLVVLLVATLLTATPLLAARARRQG